MKKLIGWMMVTAFLLGICLPGSAMANSWFDVIDFGVTNTPTPGVKAVDAALYGSRATLTWNDQDNDGTLDDNETLTSTAKLFNRKGNLGLESPASVMTGEQLEAWAEANAAEIIEIVFGGNPSFATGVTDDLAISYASFSETVLKKAVPAKKIQAMQQINNDFKASVEYLALDVNDDSGDAYSAVFGYATELDNGLELGFSLPYRYTTVDDEIDSESHYLGLAFYGKKPVYRWDDMMLTLNLGGNLFGSAYYLKSDALEDGGQLKYGAGVFSSLDKEFHVPNFDVITVSVGLDFKIADNHLPDGWIDDDDQFTKEVVDAINDLDPVKMISYGFNVGVPLMSGSAAANLEVIRTNFISDDYDNDRDAQTTVGLSFSYFPTDTFELNLGVRGTYELEDIDIYGITLGSIFMF